MADEKRGDTFVIHDPDEPLSFSAFLMGLASSALIHLGQAPHPETGRTETDLVLARQELNVLGMLHEKTRGNLTPEEKQLFDSLLADLRLRFVEASRR